MALRVGVEPMEGGRHPAWGTRNALLGLDRSAYLEVVGPDRSVPAPAGGRGLGVEGAGSGRLVTWAVRVASVADAVARSAETGTDLGAVMPGTRATTDGTLLEWVLSDPAADRLGGLVPFVIDWGASRHPSRSLADAGRVAGSVATGSGRGHRNGRPLYSATRTTSDNRYGTQSRSTLSKNEGLRIATG